VAFLASACIGCGTPLYLTHLGVGQIRLLLDREPIDDEVIARLSERERRALRLVERAQAFGERVGLAHSTSYRHLLDRGGTPPVTLVVAAPPDRLEPVTWRFPIVGRVSYRGYFDPERAQSFAASLRAQGYETDVRSANLYSTLGWFDDPLPRQLLRYESFDLCDAVLHEQVHETVFVRGDVEYNESLATFIAHRATVELLADDPATRDAAVRAFADQQRFRGLLADLSDELDRLYESGSDLSARDPLVRRYQEEVYAQIDWETDRYAAFPRARVNNAYLVARRTYLGKLPCFERELEELGGDLAAFVGRHRERSARSRESPCIGPEGEASGG
jgi:predicted aminopeptidase